MKQVEEIKTEVEKILNGNYFIKDEEAKKLMSIYEFDLNEFLIFLLPYAAEYAKVPVSNFKVGAVAMGISGNIYFGSNMEFEKEALSYTVHAEQSAVTNAWLDGESGILKLAVTSAPCGHCRQFLNELITSKELKILLQNSQTKVTEIFGLSQLLPNSFGPQDLQIDGGLMKTEIHNLGIKNINDELVQYAIDAASKSYAPYSKNYSGVSIKISDGTIFSGRYSENAAYNPSMSPLQSALAFMNMNSKKGSDHKIVDAVLVEAVSNISQKDATETLLYSISNTKLRYYKIED